MNTVQVWGAEAWPEIWKMLVALFLLNFFAWVFHGNSRIWEQVIKFDVAKNYVVNLFHKVSSLPLQRHNDNHSWKIIDKLNKAMYAMREFSGSNFMYLNTIVFSIWSLVSLAFIWREASVLLLLFSWVAFFVVVKFDKIIVPLIKERNKREHVVMSVLFDYLSNIKTVITLRFESQALQALKQKIDHVFPVFEKYSVMNEYKWFSMDMLMNVVTLTALWWYIYQQFSLEGTVLIGTMITVYQYISKMRQAFDNFTWQYSWLITLKADVEAAEDIEQEFAALPETYQVDRLHDWNELSISWLNFIYDKNKEQNVLEDVSLDLRPWLKVALVGESWSGKSTLMSLLRWLYDVDKVKLCLDESCYDDLHPLAHITSLIPQEPEIFENTIRYNIGMWLDMSDEEIRMYARLAKFDDVLQQLPNGLDTDIKEKWVNLSWGQKQRLALSRGLLVWSTSDILLLDEPTSSVDSMNEKLIYEQVLQHFSETCIVSSIHKLHLLEMFDVVYVLRKWKVVEVGDFKTLVAQDWELSKMREKYQASSLME